MLIAMAGLPGTGKSTLAARLAGELGGVVIGKDPVRAALFPPPVLDYSAEQDEIAVSAIYAAVGYVLRASPGRAVVLDGRTYRLAGQVRALFALGESVGQVPVVIECVCDDETARRRLEADLADGSHPARNRTYELYLALKATAEPVAVPHLTLDTGRRPPEECVARCLEYLRRGSADEHAP